jgi:hypothetical protein
MESVMSTDTNVRANHVLVTGKSREGEYEVGAVDGIVWLDVGERAVENPHGLKVHLASGDGEGETLSLARRLALGAMCAIVCVVVYAFLRG